MSLDLVEFVATLWAVLTAVFFVGSYVFDWIKGLLKKASQG